jgi:hypothetical protein
VKVSTTRKPSFAPFATFVLLALEIFPDAFFPNNNQRRRPLIAMSEQEVQLRYVCVVNEAGTTSKASKQAVLQF